MENKYNKTRSLVEAGLLSAIIVIIMLFNVYVPIFSMVGTFLLPIPVTILLIRYDYKVTISVIIVSAILIGMIYNPIISLTSAITYGLTGITLGYCIKNDKRFSTTLALMTSVSIISMISSVSVTLLFIRKISLREMLNEAINQFKESYNASLSGYEKFGVNTQQAESIKTQIESITPESIMTVLPAIVIIGAIILAFINIVVSKKVLSKMKYNVRNLKPLEMIYLDNRIGALIIISACLGIIFTSKGVWLGDYIFRSSALILQFAFIIDGIAVAVYYLKNKFNIGKPFLIFIVGFALLSPLGIVFMYLGIGDMIFDFRKLDPNRIFRRNKN